MVVPFFRLGRAFITVVFETGMTLPTMDHKHANNISGCGRQVFAKHIHSIISSFACLLVFRLKPPATGSSQAKIQGSEVKTSKTVN